MYVVPLIAHSIRRSHRHDFTRVVHTNGRRVRWIGDRACQPFRLHALPASRQAPHPSTTTQKGNIDYVHLWHAVILVMSQNGFSIMLLRPHGCGRLRRLMMYMSAPGATGPFLGSSVQAFRYQRLTDSPPDRSPL